MSYDYSKNIFVQESASNLLHDEMGQDVQFAYNTEWECLQAVRQMHSLRALFFACDPFKTLYKSPYCEVHGKP